ncbi:hypothetical protein [Psychromonas hadalis]|uniref:hypothetical protein n=1 Tax=Psychromonas hadalis TaxID=211669 RepID=UPI0003B45717|nr:hypothetical protein [Psychromonas hadalis]
MINRFKKTLTKQKTQLMTIDKSNYIGRVDEMFLPLVRGWAGCKDSTEVHWVKITKGEECQVVLANQSRADVLKAGLLMYENCGFSAKFSDNNIAQAHIEILVSVKPVSHSQPNYKNRKLFLLHIPKTAGSSVNLSLQNQLKAEPTYTHIEGVPDSWQKLLDARFLSGHITYPVYEKSFASANFILAAFFRQPYRHLVSHLNWVRHLMEPEKKEFLLSHPLVVQQIADKLSALNFTSIATWQQFVKQLQPVQYGLFDNLQVRYLADIKPSERVNEQHLKQALSRLKNIQLVGIAEKFNESMAVIHQAMGFDAPVERNVRSNVNSFSYGADSSDVDFQQAVEPLVKFDRLLYQQALLQFSQQQIKFAQG